MKFYNALALAIAAGVLSGCGGEVHAANGPVESDWPSYNGNLLSQRYSALTQITVSNAASLRRVCSVKLSEAGSLQAGPVVTGGTLYVTTALHTYAIDPETCATKWTNGYTPKDKVPVFVNRGVAVAGNRVVRGEPDGHLIAIDASSGKTLWDVAPASGAKGEFLSSAPIAWNDMVFIGIAGSDWGVKGRMMAFDVSSGKKLWTFSTISTDLKSWGSVRAAERGGGGMWTSYTLDPATGELFVPVANPAPDYTAGGRPGANPYTNSVVVLDAKTGALKWYRQMVPHDSHDWDLSAAPVLYTAKDGTSIVASAGKDGYIDGIDRSTHQLLFHTAGTR